MHPVSTLEVNGFSDSYALSCVFINRFQQYHHSLLLFFFLLCLSQCVWFLKWLNISNNVVVHLLCSVGHQVENAELVERWVQYKSLDAERLNAENDKHFQ